MKTHNIHTIFDGHRFRKLILAAVLLAAVVVLLGVAPPEDGLPTPDTLLNAEDRARFEALPQDVQSIVANEFLPAMRDEHQFTVEAQGDLLSFIVGKLYNVYVVNPPVQANAMDTLPGGKCYPSGTTIPT